MSEGENLFSRDDEKLFTRAQNDKKLCSESLIAQFVHEDNKLENWRNLHACDNGKFEKN